MSNHETRPDWFRLLVVGAGVGSLGFAAWLFYGDWRFAREGRSVQGIVAAKTTVVQGTGTKRRKRHMVRYRYTLDGRVFGGQDTVTGAFFEPLQEGAPVEVVYRPDAPEHSRLRGHTRWFAKFFAIAFGSICLLSGARSGRRRRHSQA